MKSLIKRDEGFTLIEIVIVLAIAAAIILMVFLAVTGARKSQRDTQRRNDVSRMAATLEQYAADNGGQYPSSTTAVTSWAGTYLTSFTAPGGGAYAAPTADSTSAAAAQTAAKAAPNTIGAYVTSGGTYTICIGAETGAGYVCASSS